MNRTIYFPIFRTILYGITQNISKNKSYNPVALKKKIESALELISISEPKPLNLMIKGQLNLLDKLTDVCIDYEVDVKCTIEVRA